MGPNKSQQHYKCSLNARFGQNSQKKVESYVDSNLVPIHSRHPLVLILTILISIYLFQNCDEISFNKADSYKNFNNYTADNNRNYYSNKYNYKNKNHFNQNWKNYNNNYNSNGYNNNHNINSYKHNYNQGFNNRYRVNNNYNRPKTGNYNRY